MLGAYNVWMDAGDRLLSTRQTSLVVDPPDGRVPVRAWAAADREERIARQRDDYRAMSTWDRCITRGIPGSMLPTGYNNAYRILQTPGLVVILHEMMWEATIEDPDVYDRPWTISMPLTRAPGYEMHDYASHEGNQDVAIYLGGGRVEEAGR